MLQGKIRELEDAEDFVYGHGNANIVAKINTLGDEALATERAKVLEAHFSETPKLEANPSTRVYYLVGLLRGWVRYYNWEE